MGESVVRVSYQATDGGELDIDGEANGIIVDPVGLGVEVVLAPSTGLGGGVN
ncbi:MAG: choice-of-anchor U domain-containing protein [Candidatus Saccharimonadales bacterium]